MIVRPRTLPARWLLRLGATLAWLLAATSAHGEELPEYRLKAAFLYNFAAFTEWPTDVGATLTLCTYGPDPFGAEIDPLTGKSAGSRRIEVHRKTNLDALKGCQIVFLAAPAMGQAPRVLETLRGLPTLIVADSPGAVRKGVMLNMTLTQSRVTFEANLGAARSAGLVLSSKLLRLATEVVQ